MVSVTDIQEAKTSFQKLFSVWLASSLSHAGPRLQMSLALPIVASKRCLQSESSPEMILFIQVALLAFIE